MPLVTSGVEYGNLRELCLARMRDLGTKCRDVRTREVRYHKYGPMYILRYHKHDVCKYVSAAMPLERHILIQTFLPQRHPSTYLYDDRGSAAI